ncbi:unnamed protein product [Phytophthora lilii]|uniref:Unnamed protein product n=1 Tax=Phytophthora lilii TaxID=2077276 RepID=A0A9W6YDI2_9STRA|nr:unnamed protein product [Phytophthora lilii]
MRLLNIALAAIVLVCGSANVQLTNSEVAAMDRRLTEDTNTVPVQRFLRNGNTDDEERMTSTSILKALPSIKKVDNAAILNRIDDFTANHMTGLTTSMQKTQLQDTLHDMNMEIMKKTKLSLNDAFKFFNLDKDVKTLLTNPKLR